MRRAYLFAASFFVLSASQAMAGVVLNGTDVDLSAKMTTHGTIYIDSDRMKMTDDDATVIYRGDLKRLWILHPENHTYQEITPEIVQQMGGQMSAMRAQAQAQARSRFAQISPEQRAQMEAGLAQMPPEQRARIEAMMAARGGPAAATAAAPAKPSFAKAGRPRTVGSWGCQGVTKTQGQEKDEDLCVASLGTVGLQAADFKVLDSIRTMVAPLGAQAQNDLFELNALQQAVGYQGIPVETVVYDQGKPTHRKTVDKVSRTAIPAATFELPRGYTKEDLPFGGAH